MNRFKTPPKVTLKGKIRIKWDDFSSFLKYNIWYPIRRPFVKVIDFIRYRTYDRYTIVKTELEPAYYDKDTLLLHSNFAILAKFVEDECAYMHLCWHEDERTFADKLYFFLPRPLDKFFRFRNREAGLKFLAFHADHNLSVEERENMGLEDPVKYSDYVTGYSAPWKELRTIYLWWRDVYANRPDPMDASGWSAWCDRKRDSGKDIFDSVPCAWDEDGVPTMYEMIDDDTPWEEKEKRRILDETHRIEKAYDDEDQDMLIRLIKARHALWT